ncbi:MAG: type II toxin-antitoxin system VapC family toxin [Thermoanaerobaculia bacterium]
MTPVVVDASVVAKWNFPEDHSEAARRLLRKAEICVPDLIWAEVGNIIWKKWRRKEITREESLSMVRDLDRFGFRVFLSERLRNSAWEIASRFDRSFYDSLYLALALKQSCPMVTADRRLYNALQGTPLAQHLLWVEDVP